MKLLSTTLRFVGGPPAEYRHGADWSRSAEIIQYMTDGDIMVYVYDVDRGSLAIGSITCTNMADAMKYAEAWVDRGER